MMQSLNRNDLAPFIEHTLLNPTSTSSDIERLCHETLENNFYGACVTTRYIEQVANFFAHHGAHAPKAVAVVGFPLGMLATEAKVFETQWAIDHGAQEIDMVLALGDFKSANEHDQLRAKSDVSQIVKTAQKRNVPVKLIIETGLLSESEIERAVDIGVQAGAQFIKTATGFLGRGAMIEDIVLIRKAIARSIANLQQQGITPPYVQIKASGGIKTAEQAIALIQAGASRLGTSSGVHLICKTDSSHDKGNLKSTY